MGFNASKVTGGLIGNIPDADPAELPAQHLYAASAFVTGVFHFSSEADRRRWIEDHSGFVVESYRVDPDIRAQFEGGAR